MAKKKKQVQETEEERKAREMTEEIAANIAKLAYQVNLILEGRMKKKTIVLLLASSAKLPQYQVERVLDAISTMDTDFLRQR